MEKSGFTEEQIIGIRREQEAGTRTTEAMLQAWNIAADLLCLEAKFGGMRVSDAKRLRRCQKPARQNQGLSPEWRKIGAQVITR